MELVESKIIEATMDNIWGILKNPSKMPLWNYKCLSSTANDQVNIGSVFDAEFKLSHDTKQTKCEVIDFQPNRKIAIRYSGDAFGKQAGSVDETFLLSTDDSAQTIVTLKIDFTYSNIPKFVQALMWLLFHFGVKTGKSSLDGLEQLALSTDSH